MVVLRTEVNRQTRDALVAAGDPERLVLDLLADLPKIVVPPVGVQEFTVLMRNISGSGAAREGELGVSRRVWRRGRRREGRRSVDELEHEGSPGNDALSPREEVSADDAVPQRGQRWSTRALRPPERRGNPTHVSRTEDLPALCEPLWGGGGIQFGQSALGRRDTGRQRALGVHNDNLRKVYGLASNCRERVLELVEGPDQVDATVALGRHGY